MCFFVVVARLPITARRREAKKKIHMKNRIWCNRVRFVKRFNARMAFRSFFQTWIYVCVARSMTSRFMWIACTQHWLSRGVSEKRARKVSKEQAFRWTPNAKRYCRWFFFEHAKLLAFASNYFIHGWFLSVSLALARPLLLCRFARLNVDLMTSQTST